MIPVVSIRSARLSDFRLTVSLLGLVAVFLGAGSSRAHAQTDAGSLRVLVLDQSSAVVPGATVTLTNANTGT